LNGRKPKEQALLIPMALLKWGAPPDKGKGKKRGGVFQPPGKGSEKKQKGHLND